MIQKRYAASILILLILCLPAVAPAQRLMVDFRQAANNDRSYGLGDVRWVQSVLQGNNAAYFEGMSVPQRIMFTGIARTPGNVHTLNFRHLATKNGKHAYDYLTSYSQALDASSVIAGPAVLVNLNECGPDFGPLGSLPALCASMHAGPHFLAVDLPDAMGNAQGHDIAASVAAYETRFGNRTIGLFGNAAITGASLVFNGYSGSKDVYAEYTLTWSSTSNAVLLEMAGHLALGIDVAGAGTGIAYGQGLGAGSISGAPFHFKLERMDGKSLGSRDNQILGNAIRIPVSCDIYGPDPACAGDVNTYTFKVSGRGFTFAWSLANNTSGASIAGSTNGQSVQVNAGTTAGSYDLIVDVNAGGQILHCVTPVTVHAVGVTASATPILCNGDASTVTVTPNGGTPPYDGAGSFSVLAGTHSFTITDANGCSATTTLTITEPPLLVANAIIDDVICTTGSPTNVVIVTASGGTPPYTGTGTFYTPTGQQTFVVTDANGCTTNATVTSSQVQPLTISAIANPILCHGGSTTVVVSASGGAPPYIGTGTFTVSAGTYTYSVTDDNGCSASTTVTVSEPPQLTASATATPLACGVLYSTVTVTASGGTPPYSGTGTFSAPAGTHTYTVTDANGCSATVTITIQGTGSVLNVSASATPIPCYGGTSTVTVTATGGTPPYTGTGTFTRTAGTWSFTVTDSGNCSGTATITITEPAAPLVASSSATPILCHGGASTVTVTASGGTPPYTGVRHYARIAGTYTFTVTDSNNCAATTTITITQPQAALTVDVSATPILCNGGTSTVTVTASGGTPPYNGTGTFYVPAGTYTYTVTDSNGCSKTSAPITINQPAAALTVSVNATPILCFGGNSTVTVTASGGTPPYSGTGIFSVPAGTYTYTVTDANGCSAASAPITITQPASALTVSASATPILCFGGNSTITVTASGGTPPYTGTGTFSAPAGTYTYTVTDANGCSAASAPITITQPQAALTVNTSATPILCNGGTSTVTVTASGGTPPYNGTGTFTVPAGTYTYTVTDANGCSTTSAPLTVTEPPLLTASASATPIPCNGGNSTVTVTAAGGTPPYSGTGTYSVPAGTYTYTVTDINGCSASTTITIQSQSQIIVDASATPILCHGGTSTVTVTATGGTPPYVGTGTFTHTAGTYTFTVTDASNCSGTATITITQPQAALTVDVSATPILCNGGTSTVTVTASGGTPPYNGTGTFTVPAGTYTYTVTDANGCSKTSAPITVTEPPTLNASAIPTPILCHGGTSAVTVGGAGGTPPYTGTGTFTYTAGTYLFTVTDANGCWDTVSVTLSDPPALAAHAGATPILCAGGNSTVTVTATGGTPGYSGTGTFTRTAGTYTFTVSDANGCAASVTVVITEPPALTAGATSTPVACNGDSAVVTVTAAGGTPPYIGIGSFVRAAGTYSFLVTDANGCQTTVIHTVSEPQPMNASAIPTPILCYGGTSTVTVGGAGGTPPYNGAGTFTLPAGTYSFTVTDANGCWDTVSVTLTEPPVLAAHAGATPILCAGGNSTVTVTATGGTPGYSGTGTFTRTVGTYTFVVTDANGCAASISLAITEPPALTAGATHTPIMCNGDTSVVTVTAAGGTPPYVGTGTFVRAAGTYSFLVTDANGCSTTVIYTVTEPPVMNASAIPTPILCFGGMSSIDVGGSGGTPPYTGTGIFTRPAGTYTFTVTDANGCWDTVTVTLTEPPQLFAHAGATPILCAGDQSTITVTATGGTPGYSGTGTFPRPAGTYTFIVSDANGCAASITLTVTEPPALTAGATATPIMCNGDSAIVTVTAAGGTPPYSGIGNYTVVSGTYTYTVTDYHGCTTSTTIIVVEPPTLVAAADAPPIPCTGGTTTITVSASGGTPPYNGVGTFSHGAGTYTFIVTDANGCADTTTITLIDPPPLTAASTATPILCYGEETIVTVTATGGTAPYFGIGNFSRGAGTYTFTVTDARGCFATTTITLTEPPALTAYASAPPVNCGSDSAAVTVTASGGTPPYSGVGVFYRKPGSYTFFVSDANGCAASVTVNVIGPPELEADVTATPILCNGGVSTINVTATGGTPPYTGTGTFTQGAGTYTYVVTDGRGCTDTVTIVVTQPPPFFLNCGFTECKNGVRTIYANPQGGTPPYTYLWLPGSYTSPTLDVPCSWSGTVTVRVRDANWNPNDPNNSSCEATCTITVLVKAAGDPAAVSPSDDYALFENYPNPFNPSTTITYYLPEASQVRLSIHDMLGRTIDVLVDAEMRSGMHQVQWDATTDAGIPAQSGSYIYRIHAKSKATGAEFTRERLMMLLR